MSKEVETILKERSTTHGDYTFQAFRCQRIQRCFTDAPGWDELNDIQRDALQMIAVKISRILTGNPNHKDNWLDLAGYATLVANRIEE